LTIFRSKKFYNSLKIGRYFFLQHIKTRVADPHSFHPDPDPQSCY
jgi:hypothetical protein